MKKILAAVDFSEPSVNAAQYALAFAEQLVNATLVLYYVYNPVTAGSDGTPLSVNDDDRKTIALAALQNIRQSIASKKNVTIDLVVEAGNLVENIEKYVKHHAIDIVIMGIKGSTQLEQVFIGSTTLNVINRDICPVMIIPENAIYKKISTVILTSDLQDVENSTPLGPLKRILDVLKASLLIVNVTTTNASVTDAYRVEKGRLEHLLQDYKPKTYFVLEEEFEKGITDFTEEYNIDLIITSPKKHSFLSRIFRLSHTQKLAFTSHLPILAINAW